MNIIILPGNPPAEFYYRAWIDELKLIHTDVNFYYFDYCEPKNDLSPTENLTFMEKDLCARVNEVSDTGQTIIIAHSFGAYFLNNYYNKESIYCVLIYPFVGNPTLRGKLALDMAYYSSPLFNIKFFRKVFKSFLEFYMPTTLKIKASELNKGIKIAKIESLILRNTIRPGIPNKIKNATLFYNTADNWSPLSTINFLSEKMNSVEANFAHDFVLDEKERNGMTNVLNKLLHQFALLHLAKE